MADILIRGMGMPKSCGFCDLRYFIDDEGDCCPFVGDALEYQTRPDKCPLIALPEHGDLIDRGVILHEDVLHYVDTLNSSFGSRVKFSDLVRGAPVIVPPNKGEEA